MGTEEIWIPLALAAVSGTAAYVNQRNVAHQQDQTLAAQLRAQAAKQQQADAQTSQLINKEAQSTDTQDKAKAQLAYNTAIAQKAPQATTALAAPNSASKAYAADKLNAALGVSDYGNQQADWLSSIQAPEMQRQRDQIENIDPYRTNIGLIARANAGDNFLSNLKLNSIKPNPWLSLVQGVSGGAAGAMAKGGFGSGDTIDTTGMAALGSPNPYYGLGPQPYGPGT